jgi:D-amino-acid oxidase
LTGAVALAEGDHRVRVLTAEPPEDTTSAAAGALWGLWGVAVDPTVLLWAAASLRALTDLAERPRSGVRMASGRSLSAVDHPLPAWFDLLTDVRPCTDDELLSGHRRGMRYTAPMIDMPSHLPYLVRRLLAAGGEIQHRHVDSLGEVSSDADLVIDCAGVGARQLAADLELIPVRGQQLVGHQPPRHTRVHRDRHRWQH